MSGQLIGKEAITLNPNPFTLPKIINMLKVKAGVKELSALRQLSNDYYSKLSTAYFDKCRVMFRVPTDFEPLIIPEEAPIYIFRRVLFCDFSFMHPDLDIGEKRMPRILAFLRKISPFVTDVCLLPTFFGLHGLENVLEELINSFKRLEFLEFKDNWDIRYSDKACGLIQLLSEKTKIHIHAIPDKDSGVGQRSSSVVRIAQKFNPKNVTMEVEIIDILCEDEFEELVLHTIDWFNVNKDSTMSGIQHVNIYLNNNSLRNEPKVLNYMSQLMSCWKPRYLHLVQVDKENKLDLSLVPNLGNWKENIISLRLHGYSSPILFLHEFRRLINLDLWEIDINSCLFSNTSKTNEKNLAEIFERIIFDRCLVDVSGNINAPGYGKIAFMNPLTNYVKTIIPNFITFDLINLNQCSLIQ